ncbi:hypothetical protein FA13DRAFT_1726871 [Coprinellus micaceus]|uniref:F-box domain-containing protein n=1 Tax=Coprinellus micaceus TaxID=71717 RepID=A0A4Y7TQP6_COPMI|nr:hypothetical protein FA13DRAFT_1726871 [Coprinellus micaceus]
MLPIELWTHISSLSTFDDGYTVRSLGRVSRFFKEAAEPFRLRIVSVCSARRIIELTSYLESLPGEKRNIEFLHATCPPPREPAVTIALASFYKAGVCDRNPGPSPVCMPTFHTVTSNVFYLGGDT